MEDTAATLRFTPLEVYQYTANAKSPHEADVSVNLHTITNKNLKTAAPIELGGGLFIQILEVKGLAPGNFKDIKFLATRTNGVSDEFNDRAFEFNSVRISARIYYVSHDRQICSTNIDFQVYRNGNYRFGLGNLSNFKPEETPFPIIIRDGMLQWFEPDDNLLLRTFELKFDTIKARFQFNGHIKASVNITGTIFAENIEHNPELSPHYHITKLDGIDPNLFSNHTCKNYQHYQKGPGRYPILITQTGVVHITRAWSMSQLNTMQDVLHNFIREMVRADIIQIDDDFAVNKELDKQTKKRSGVNYRKKKREELVEILKRMNIHDMPIGDGVGIAKNLLVDLVEKKVNEREHKEMESLIDNAVACIEDDKENQEWVFAADETLYSPPQKRHHSNDVEGVALEASASPVLLDRNAVLH